MLKDDSQVSEIISLDFTPRESEILWAEISASGYEKTLDGMKLWIMDIVNGNNQQVTKGSIDPRAIKSVVDFFGDNPEVIKSAKKKVINFATKTLFKF